MRLNASLLFWLVFCSVLAPSLSSEEAFGEKAPAIRPIDYKIDLRVDLEKEKIFGTCRLTVVNFSEKPVSRVAFLLYRLLRVTSVRDDQGKDLPFTQRVLAFEDWEKFQANFIEAGLLLAAGGKTALNISYEGHLLGYTETGMLYVKDRVDKDFTIVRMDCLAYPQPGYPSWEANRAAGLPNFDYEIRVTVPESYVAANGGEMTGRVSKDGWVTYSYRNLKPAWRMDIAVSRYGLLEDKTNNLRVFYFQDDHEGAADILEALTKTMDLYSDWFGPLEKKTGFAIIEVPEGFGSQADVTSILQTRDAFKNQDQVFQLYHEISHLWNVPSRDPFTPRFESEGLAMFLQYQVQEKLERKEGALEKGAARLAERFRQACQEDPRSKDTPMIDYGKARLTDLSYSKGMIFFFLLYELMGEKDFYQAVGSFYQKFKTSGATAGEFLDHLVSRSKVDLTRLFEDWIYGTESSRDLLSGLSFSDMIKKYREEERR